MNNDVQVSDLLDQSSILVFSIYQSESDPYLERLAERNGGFAEKAERGRDLEGAFDRIIKALGGMYFLNFYTKDLPRRSQIKIKARGASLTWKIHW